MNKANVHHTSYQRQQRTSSGNVPDDKEIRKRDEEYIKKATKREKNHVRTIPFTHALEKWDQSQSFVVYKCNIQKYKSSTFTTYISNTRLIRDIRIRIRSFRVLVCMTTKKVSFNQQIKTLHEKVEKFV